VMRAPRKALFAVTSLDEGGGDNLTARNRLFIDTDHALQTVLPSSLGSALLNVAPALDDC
jgi:hypothetical protein